MSETGKYFIKKIPPKQDFLGIKCFQKKNSAHVRDRKIFHKNHSPHPTSLRLSDVIKLKVIVIGPYIAEGGGSGGQFLPPPPPEVSDL